MAGVFDSLMSDDPKEQAYMALAAGLLSGRGNFNKVAGEALMGSQNVYRQAQEAKARQQQQMLQQQMMQMQLDAAKRQQRLSGMAQQFVRPGMKPETMDNRDVGMPSEQAIPATSFDMPGYITALMGEDPVEALKLQAATAKQAPQPIKLGKDDRLLHPTTFQPLVGAAPEKPDKGTSDMQEFAFALSRGEVPPGQSFTEWMRANKRAGASTSSQTIINRQETEEARTVGKGFGDQYVAIQNSGVTAASKINKYNRIQGLMQGYETGRLTPLGKEIASFAQSIGLKIDPTLSNKEAFESLSRELALEARSPSGGAGMPGALSDQDRIFLESMVPGLSKTKGGNMLIIETNKRLAKREQDVAKLAREYRKQRGTLDEGFYDKLAEFSEKNPLFADMASPQNVRSAADAIISKP